MHWLILFTILFGLRQPSQQIWKPDIKQQSWKLDIKQKDGVLSSLTWVNGEAQVEAVSANVMARLSSRAKVHHVDTISHAVLVIPPAYDGGIGEYGEMLILVPGQKATLPGLGKQPRDVALHKEGVFFSHAAGNVYTCAFFHLNESDPEKQIEILFEEDLARVREGDTKIQFSEHEVTVASGAETKSFRPHGKRGEGKLDFFDPTPQNLDVMEGTFHGRNLTGEAAEGKLEVSQVDELLLSQIIHNLLGKKNRSVVVWGNQGTNPEGMIGLLAQRIAEGKVPEDLKGFQVIEFSIADFGTESYVDLTPKKMGKLLDAARQKRVILYFPDIDRLIGLGVGSGGPEAAGPTSRIDAAFTMLQDLSAGRILVVGSTSDRGIHVMRQSGRFFASFREFQVSPPKGERLLELLRYSSNLRQNEHRVHFSDEILKKIVRECARHLEEQEPAKSLGAISEIAKRNAHPNPSDDGGSRIEITEDMVIEWFAEKTRIYTLIDSEKGTGLAEFVKPNTFKAAMDENIVGHPHAKEAIRKVLLNVLEGSGSPQDEDTLELGVGALLFLGPSGVGKSMAPPELSRRLKKFGVNWPVETRELENLKDEAAVRSLTGAPPGYIGFSAEGGSLYQFVSNNPQGIIVLEELDKTHKSIMDVLYKFLDDGVVEDASGKKARFNRGIVFLTSNFGSIKEAKLVMESGGVEKIISTNPKACDLVDDWDRWHLFGKEPNNPDVKSWSEEELRDALIERLQEAGVISPQFVGRIGRTNIVILHHLNQEEMATIGNNALNKIMVDIKKTKGIEVEFTQKLREWMVNKAWGKDGASTFEQGARSAIDVVKNEIKPVVNDYLLLHNGSGVLKGKRLSVELEKHTAKRLGKDVEEFNPTVTVKGDMR